MTLPFSGLLMGRSSPTRRMIGSPTPAGTRSPASSTVPKTPRITANRHYRTSPVSTHRNEQEIDLSAGSSHRSGLVHPRRLRARHCEEPPAHPVVGVNWRYSDPTTLPRFRMGQQRSSLGRPADQ